MPFLSELKSLIVLNDSSVKEYFEQHGDDIRREINATDLIGDTLLKIAAQHDATGDVVRLLLLHGANVDQADGAHFTALHSAAMAGKYPAVAALLDGGANVFLRTIDGYSALNYATRKRAVASNGEEAQRQVVASLLDHYAAIYDRTEELAPDYAGKVAIGMYPEPRRGAATAITEENFERALRSDQAPEFLKAARLKLEQLESGKSTNGRDADAEAQKLKIIILKLERLERRVARAASKESSACSPFFKSKKKTSGAAAAAASSSSSAPAPAPGRSSNR